MPKKSATVAEKPARSMSDSHKEALAKVGSREGWSVATGRRWRPTGPVGGASGPPREHPEAPGRDRGAHGEADALSRLHLLQERMDLEGELLINKQWWAAVLAE